MITKVSSATKTVEISPEGPTVWIGERINPTARKKLGEALLVGNVDLVRNEARIQVEAGAHILDVNVGFPGVDEPRMIKEVIKAVMETTDVPLCLDSASPEVMEAGLSVYKGKIILSSVTGEREKMDEILPLVKKYGTAVVALCMDDTGIPNDAEERLGIVRKIVERADALGIPREDIIVDTACMTCSTDTSTSFVTLQTIELVRKVFGLNQTLGASNVSFGLPERKTINQAYLPMAIYAGVNCPIIDPTVAEINKALLSTDLLLGKDEFGMNYLKAYRARQAALEAATQKA